MKYIMFEKLREYGLYILIGVISLGLLGVYFISTTNSKKGVKYYDDVQVGFLRATAVSSTAKKEIKGTINDYVKLDNKQFGDYKINDEFGIVVLKGTNTKDVVVDGTFNIETKCNYLDKLHKNEDERRKIADEKNLIQVMIPINGDNLLDGVEDSKDETYIIKKDKIITCEGKEIDIKGKSPEERGFFNSALFGLGFFKNKTEAKSFRDKYLNANGMMIESETTPFVVFDVNGAVNDIAKSDNKGRSNPVGGTTNKNEQVTVPQNTSNCGEGYEELEGGVCKKLIQTFRITGSNFEGIEKGTCENATITSNEIIIPFKKGETECELSSPNHFFEIDDFDRIFGWGVKHTLKSNLVSFVGNRTIMRTERSIDEQVVTGTAYKSCFSPKTFTHEGISYRTIAPSEFAITLTRNYKVAGFEGGVKESYVDFKCEDGKEIILKVRPSFTKCNSGFTKVCNGGNSGDCQCKKN